MLLCAVFFERRFHAVSVAAIRYIKTMYGLLRRVMVYATAAVKIVMVIMSRIVYAFPYVCVFVKYQKALNAM